MLPHVVSFICQLTLQAKCSCELARSNTGFSQFAGSRYELATGAPVSLAFSALSRGGFSIPALNHLLINNRGQLALSCRLGCERRHRPVAGSDSCQLTRRNCSTGQAVADFADFSRNQSCCCVQLQLVLPVRSSNCGMIDRITTRAGFVENGGSN